MSSDAQRSGRWSFGASGFGASGSGASGAMARAARLASHGLWMASMAPGVRRFSRALQDPDAAQAALLRAHLRDNAQTEWGRRHGYDGLNTLEAFQDQVPISTYDDLAPDIERAANGAPSVLTAASIRLFERSSGSSAATKLIPYTDGLKAQFAAATDPWLGSLHGRIPGVVGGLAYWSISPAARARETTAGGHPIGIEDDAEYLSPIARALVGRLLAVPGRVARVSDIESWRRLTLRHLLEAEALTLLSVWSPTFLTVLMTYLAQHWDAIVGSLPAGRRRSLDAAIRGRGIVGEALWPRLRVLSCWTDAAARRSISGLRAFFPNVSIQPKGLLATEGVVSLPWLGRRTTRDTEHPELGRLVPSVLPLAITSHVLEFLRSDALEARPIGPRMLEIGGHYQPLITTAGGLARYRLGDEIVCTGYVGRTPTVALVGKADTVSDLCGEKLSANHVQRALDAAADESGFSPRFAMVVPRPNATPLRYEVMLDRAEVEGMGSVRTRRFVAALEAELASNVHYAYARQLGQLGTLRTWVVADAEAHYLANKIACGMRAGDVKSTPLDPHWSEDYSTQNDPAREAPTLDEETT